MHGTAQHNKQINTSLGVLSCLVCGFILITYFNDNIPVILVNHFDLIIWKKRKRLKTLKANDIRKTMASTFIVTIIIPLR